MGNLNCTCLPETIGFKFNYDNGCNIDVANFLVVDDVSPPFNDISCGCTYDGCCAGGDVLKCYPKENDDVSRIEVTERYSQSDPFENLVYSQQDYRFNSWSDGDEYFFYTKAKFPSQVEENKPVTSMTLRFFSEEATGGVQLLFFDFSNSCTRDGSTLFEVGDKIGWMEITHVGLPSEELCPSYFTEAPSMMPSNIPSNEPSTQPSISVEPSGEPSESQHPSTFQRPSQQPSISRQPSQNPTQSIQPSTIPSRQPTQSQRPSIFPSKEPSQIPSPSPSDSTQPSPIPSAFPSSSFSPSMIPTKFKEEICFPTEELNKNAPSQQPSVSNSPSGAPSGWEENCGKGKGGKRKCVRRGKGKQSNKEGKGKGKSDYIEV